MIDLSIYENLKVKCSRCKESYLTIDTNGLCLVIDEKSAEQIRKFIGGTVRVMYTVEDPHIVLAFGDDRRLCRRGAMSKQAVVSLASVTERFIEKHGEFKRLFMKGRWEQDARGNKVFLFEPTGRKEMANNIVYRKLKVSA